MTERIRRPHRSGSRDRRQLVGSGDEFEAILDWAKVRGYREGDNPARWRGHLSKLLPARTKMRKVKDHAALAYDEMPDFMAALRKQHGAAARAFDLQF